MARAQPVYPGGPGKRPHRRPEPYLGAWPSPPDRRAWPYWLLPLIAHPDQGAAWSFCWLVPCACSVSHSARAVCTSLRTPFARWPESLPANTVTMVSKSCTNSSIGSSWMARVEHLQPHTLPTKSLFQVAKSKAHEAIRIFDQNHLNRLLFDQRQQLPHALTLLVEEDACSESCATTS